MKKIILLLLLIAIPLGAQSNLLKMEKKRFVAGSAVGLNGTDQYTSISNPVGISDNGPEILANGGFETYTGTQGNGLTATYTSWVDVNGSNTVLACDTVNTNYGGANALRLNGSATGWVRQTVTVLPSTKYALTFWTAGDGTNAGRYKVYDLTHSADILGITSTAVTSGTYSIIRYVFTAPAGCTQIRIEFIAPATGYALFDQCSFRRIYDLSISIWLKRETPPSSGREYILSKYYGDYGREWNLRFIGTGEGADADTGKISFGIGYIGDSNGFSNVQSTTKFAAGQWYFVTATLQNVGLANSVMKIYVNGVLEATNTSVNIPSYNSGSLFCVGSVRNATVFLHYFKGQIGEVQIVRFTDISQSNVSAATLTQAYRRGIPSSWIGGGSQVVAWYDFRGVSDGQMLRDKSGTGNNLTGVNVSQSGDQVKAQYPSR